MSYSPSSDRSLPKSQRLSSLSIIDKLFAEGQHVFSYPFKLQFLLLKDDDQIGSPRFSVTVPKRSHKAAVTRNLIKRRVREAYRINKPDIPPDHTVALMYIYVAKDVMRYAQIEKAMTKVNQQLINKLSSY